MKILDKILLAFDFGPSSENLFKNTIQFAKVFDSSIIPLHVLPETIKDPKTRNLLPEAIRSRFQEVISGWEVDGLNIEMPLVRFGNNDDLISRTAVEVNANLILMGSGEGTSNRTFKLGTTTERVVQKSDKPVLVIKEGAALNVKRILCPVDFSSASERALKNALIIARRYQAELIILSVCELSKRQGFNLELHALEDDKNPCMEHGQSFLEFLKKFTMKDVKWVQKSPAGNPVDEILTTLKTEDIDLLVMGASGRTGISRLIMGRVTAKVIREVPCSFLTLKSQDVITPQISRDIEDIEKLYESAVQLIKDGIYENAINILESIINLNAMHLPSYRALAKIYELLDQPEKAKAYRDRAREIMDHFYYSKIEDEIRRNPNVD